MRFRSGRLEILSHHPWDLWYGVQHDRSCLQFAYDRFACLVLGPVEFRWWLWTKPQPIKAVQEKLAGTIGIHAETTATEQDKQDEVIPGFSWTVQRGAELKIFESAFMDNRVVTVHRDKDDDELRYRCRVSSIFPDPIDARYWIVSFQPIERVTDDSISLEGMV